MKIARKAVAAVAASLTIALLLWQGLALAVDGVRDLGLGGSSSESGEAYTPETQSVQQPAEPPDEPTDEGDNAGHETENPEKPDHAGGSIIEAELAGGDLATVGRNDASIEDDGTTHGDVVVLALLGSDIIAASSECNEVDCENTDGVAPGVLCAESGGSLCVGLLFAETTSTTNSDSSSATADQALAYACVGGTQQSPDENCDGVVGAGVSENHSSITQDNTTGATQADQSTDVADVCLGGEDLLTGACGGVGVSALHSESHSTAESETGPGTTERSSYILALELAGEEAFAISDPAALSIPPDCPEPSLVCIFVNQGEGFVYTGGGASRQEALHVDVLNAALGGADLVEAHVATAETLAENTGPACPPGSTAAHCVRPPVCPDTGVPPMPDGSCPREPAPGLARTGLDIAVPIAVALALLVAGFQLVAWDRRRAVAAA